MKQKMGLKGLRNKYKNDNDNRVSNINVNSTRSSSSNNNVGGDGKVICVAVRASKEISKRGLLWALTHVVQPGDSIKLLLVIPLSKRMWDLSRFISDCTYSQKSLSENNSSEEDQNDILDSCSKMFVQLHDVYNPDTVKIRIKIVSCSPSGVVSSEAKRIQASWVILDKQLKCEKKHCIEELDCNIVVMKQQGPEILRLNFANSSQFELEKCFFLPPKSDVCLTHKTDEFEQSNGTIRGPVVTPASSPEPESPLTRTDFGTTSISSPSDPESIFSPGTENPFDKSLVRTYGALLENLSRIGRETDVGFLNYRLDLNLSRSVREAIDLTSKAPPGPPPLCSVCRHKSPTFGKPPRWFSYGELEIATGGFLRENYLAEGGFGSVYRGVLPGGQVVAVKQHKSASSQGDAEFCSEVEVLSCAQHRNVVMLIGLCVEEERRLLVYEYICNGSLDSHLYGQDREPLEWAARKRIAVGAARGLRYLHEECRVGCIVHRDLRPNNILLTHDFEPLVGDFGLARWQPDGGKEVETRVIGTFGYLAPEYAQSGQITEKADVYSFGVVLVELVTGRKAMDINRPKGQQSLTEWARPLLENLSSVEELVDPRIRNGFSKQEVQDVLLCASLCIRRDPHSRPRVSQVLRILEGDSDVNSMMKA